MLRIESEETLVPGVLVEKYQAVGVDGKPTTTTGQTVRGVCLYPNQYAEQGIGIVKEGQLPVKIGETITAGDPLTGGANGELMKARDVLDIDFHNSLYTYARDRSKIVALEDGIAGDIIDVLIY